MCRQRRLIHWIYLIGCFSRISLNLLSSPPIRCHALSFVFICTWKSSLIEPLILATTAFVVALCLKSANLLKCLSEFHTPHACAFLCQFFSGAVPRLLCATDRRLCPVTCSSLFQTLMLSALPHPAGPYHVVYHLKSMYSCTLRSSAIRQDYPCFIEVVTSLHRSWHILLFVLHHFLLRPRRCLPETMLSSLLSAHSTVTD